MEDVKVENVAVIGNNIIVEDPEYNGRIIFGLNGVHIIELWPDGDIWVRGKLTENDTELVAAMWEFLRGAKEVK